MKKTKPRRVAPGAGASAEIPKAAAAAELLRCDIGTIYRLLKSGQIPRFKIGTDWRVTPEALDQWIAAGMRVK